MSDPYEVTLRRLMTGDQRLLSEHLDLATWSEPGCAMDAKACALQRLAALIGIGASIPSYTAAVADTILAGAVPEEVVAVLLAVAPVVGVARVVAAAPSIGLALGYDVDAALETLDET
jgi:4-carboxymuconolactone decarboxylase